MSERRRQRSHALWASTPAAHAWEQPVAQGLGTSYRSHAFEPGVSVLPAPVRPVRRSRRRFRRSLPLLPHSESTTTSSADSTTHDVLQSAHSSGSCTQPVEVCPPERLVLSLVVVRAPTRAWPRPAPRPCARPSARIRLVPAAGRAARGAPRRRLRGLASARSASAGDDSGSCAASTCSQQPVAQLEGRDTVGRVVLDQVLADAARRPPRRDSTLSRYAWYSAMEASPPITSPTRSSM